MIANCNIFYDSLISREKIYAWIIELSSPETREAALLELSKKREVEKISDQTIAFHYRRTPCLDDSDWKISDQFLRWFLISRPCYGTLLEPWQPCFRRS